MGRSGFHDTRRQGAGAVKDVIVRVLGARPVGSEVSAETPINRLEGRLVNFGSDMRSDLRHGPYAAGVFQPVSWNSQTAECESTVHPAQRSRRGEAMKLQGFRSCQEEKDMGRKATTEGAMAFEDGRPRSGNPYDPSSEAWMCWRDGYEQARAASARTDTRITERESLDGTP